jgi:hypothetical protein
LYGVAVNVSVSPAAQVPDVALQVAVLLRYAMKTFKFAPVGMIVGHDGAATVIVCENGIAALEDMAFVAVRLMANVPVCWKLGVKVLPVPVDGVPPTTLHA